MDTLPSGAYGLDYHEGRRRRRSFRYRLRRRTQEVAEALRRHLTAPPRVIVDVGTADGLMLAGLARTLGDDAMLVGCDISLPLLTAVDDDRVHKVLADGARLPLADRVADAVIATAIIEHVDDPRALALEARRVLRPHGILVVTTPVPAMDHLASALGLLKESGHQFHFNLDDLGVLGRACGMEVQEARKFMFSPIGFPAERALERILGPIGLSLVMANQLCVLRRPADGNREGT